MPKNLGPISGGDDVVTRDYVLETAGQQMLVNGSGMIGTYNWPISSYCEAVVTDVYAGRTSFKVTGLQRNIGHDKEFISVDPAKTYRMSGAFKGTPDTRQSNYLYVSCRDVDTYIIAPYQGAQIYRRPASQTTLAAPLKVGDTTITLVDGSGWTQPANRGVIVFPYVNSKGFAYPNYTYSRHCKLDNYTISGNTVTLTSAWNVPNPNAGGPDWPVGTPVEQTQSGGSLLYPSYKALDGTGGWNLYEGDFGAGTSLTFWYGTAFVGTGALVNYPSGGTSSSVTLLSAFSVKELPLSHTHADYVNKSGDTMTGPLSLPTPSASAHAATKQYVDDAVAAAGGGSGDYLPLTGGAVTGPVVIRGEEGMIGFSPDPAATFETAEHGVACNGNAYLNDVTLTGGLVVESSNAAPEQPAFEVRAKDGTHAISVPHSWSTVNLGDSGQGQPLLQVGTWTSLRSQSFQVHGGMFAHQGITLPSAQSEYQYHAVHKEYVDSRSPKTVVLAPGESVPPGLEGGSVVVTGAQAPRFVASSGAYSTATTTSISIPPSPLARAGDTCIVVVSSDNAGAYTVDIPGMSPLLPPFVSGNQYTNVLYRTWSDSSTLAGTLSQLRSFNASAWWLRDGVLGTPGSVGIRSATSFSVTAPQTTTTGAGRVFAIFGARTIAATAAENDPTLSLTWGSVDDVQWGDSTLSASTAISRLWLVSMPSSGGGLVPDNTATMLDNSGNAFGFLIPYYSGSTPVYLPTVDEVIRQIDYGPRVSGKGSISSTSATTGINTKLNLALTSGSGVTVASNAITVTKAGWYMIHYMLQMTGAVGTPVRIFQEIQINSEVVARTSRGVNEDRQSLSALCWMDTTSPAVFNFYQITGATVTVSGSWSLKYLGSA